ncbi:YHS domain-containing protein [Metallosphaera hakonensis JCM 8857 = DSM 7519]|uniref:YHS domain-containing protein n=1 Tax=Metallosphaera hakonensis JCM 8857 = DSM 7519 TaxID=1293036 RepID=A0A2U9IT31_9CREN|nr:YHS domain-containing protein [Metallosphaera hakonensis JCM 8857 = DSM 7519]
MMDPVCGMEVDEKSNYKTMYRGKMYYFCSSHCKSAFEKDPETYLKGGPKGMPHEHAGGSGESNREGHGDPGPHGLHGGHHGS